MSPFAAVLDAEPSSSSKSIFVRAEMSVWATSSSKIVEDIPFGVDRTIGRDRVKHLIGKPELFSSSRHIYWLRLHSYTIEDPAKVLYSNY